MDTLLQELWKDYRKITPTIIKVKHALNLNGYNEFCDHIAFRTISTSNVSSKKNCVNNFGLKKIRDYFLNLGYNTEKYYHFKEKHLRGVHLEKKDYPKILISEILLNKCSPLLKQTLLEAFKQQTKETNILIAGRNWKVNYKTYKILKKESEYAAWLYIHGHRVNHFTINVNYLKGYSIENVCAKLKTCGIKLNNFGGLIKGNEKLGLKQACTMADEIFVIFDDLKYPIEIPSCYVEFAERFVLKNKMFEGFIAESADKNFLSTNTVTERL